MKKMVLKFDYPNEKTKQKGMKKVSGISGVDSIAVDSNNKKMTITGDVDLVVVVDQLRKICPVDIIFFGPIKEPEKNSVKQEIPLQAQQQLLPWQYSYGYYHPAY